MCILIKNIKRERNFSKESETKDKDTNTRGLSTSKANDTKKKGRVKKHIEHEIEEKPIVIKEELYLNNTKHRYYLQQSLRSSLIPKTPRAEIEKFASIQNVSDDGNCGIYSIMEGLYHNSIDFNEDVDMFRKSISDYIDCNRNKVFMGLKFRNKRMSDGTTRGKHRNEFIDKEIIQRIWNDSITFNLGCDSEYWVDSHYVFPIIAQMYKLNVVWYSIVDGYNTNTNATIWKDNSWVDIERNGIQNPFVIIPGTNW